MDNDHYYSRMFKALVLFVMFANWQTIAIAQVNCKITANNNIIIVQTTPPISFTGKLCNKKYTACIHVSSNSGIILIEEKYSRRDFPIIFSGYFTRTDTPPNGKNKQIDMACISDSISTPIISALANSMPAIITGLFTMLGGFALLILRDKLQKDSVRKQTIADYKTAYFTTLHEKRDTNTGSYAPPNFSSIDTKGLKRLLNIELVAHDIITNKEPSNYIERAELVKSIKNSIIDL